jgi:enolase
MSIITGIKAWMALDSRGWPTPAVRVEVAGGHALAIAPAGASTGMHEDPELRDHDLPWEGRGVSRSIAYINGPLAEVVVGIEASDPWALDEALDRRRPPGGWGGNTTVAVTLAATLAEADARSLEPWQWIAHLTGTTNPSIPMPMVNIVSGGAHAGRAIDLQDILVIPLGARDFGEAIEMASTVRRSAALLASRSLPLLGSLVADEGGVAAPSGSNVAALELVAEAIDSAGLSGGVSMAVDVAATQFFHEGSYTLTADGAVLDGDALSAQLREWTAAYPIVSIEDAFAEDDWGSWSAHAKELGCAQVIGDDLIATNAERARRAFDTGAANCVLLKVNQAGSVGRALAVLAMARDCGMRTVVSARSGETEQHWLSDLAVGSGAGQIKVGSTHRSERSAKWNRLLELEARYGSELRFAGASALASHGDFRQGVDQ